MILETVALFGTLVIGLGTGLAIGSKINTIDGPTVKVIKVAFTHSGDVFINMIENGDKRSISYVYKNHKFKNDAELETRLKDAIPAIYNHIMLWINFDVNTYPDVSSTHGVSYESK